MWLNRDFFGTNLQVVIGEGELRFVDLDFFACWVLNANGLAAAFTHCAQQLDLLNVFGLFNCHYELVEDVLASGFLSEVNVEFVDARLKSEEIQLVFLE